MSERDEAPEPPLARAALDRDAPTRLNASELARVLHSDEARFVLVAGDRMVGSLHRPEVVTFTSAELTIALEDDIDERHALFLGRTVEEATPIFAVESRAPLDLNDISSRIRRELSWLVLREDIDALSDRDAGIFTTALALTNWHRSAQFSAETGVRTIPAQGGWMRTDSETGGEIYPRTDPAIIVLITDQNDRVLLGSHILWNEHRFSLLAGFVEAGESLEAAVHREMAEEAGVRVSDVKYVSSQPWPFPRSLMMGFTARLAADQHPDDIIRDESELADLRWFTREELLSAETAITLPGSASIARFMIDGWLLRKDGFV